MTKKLQTDPSRRPFTPRVTPVAERVDAIAAPFEFPPEADPAPSIPEPVAPAPRLARIPPVDPPARLAAPRQARRLPLIWLGIAVAASASAVWVAGRAPDHLWATSAPWVSEASTSPELQSRRLALVAAQMVQPTVVPSRIRVARAAARTGEQARPRSRTDSRPAFPVPATAIKAAREGNDTDASTTFYGALIVDSEPAGARVYINGQPLGSTPVVLERVPAGSRVVRVEADGYQSWSAAVRVVASEQTRIAVRLRR